MKTVDLEPIYLGGFPIPSGYKKCDAEIKNCCGQLAISAILNVPTTEVFRKANIPFVNLEKGTSQKKMREILSVFGVKVKQRVVKDKFTIPKIDLGIVRVSFGNPEQHWIETTKRSHYLAVKRFNAGIYVLDNAKVDGGFVWIERTEYKKVIDSDNMFVTSYLEAVEYPVSAVRDAV